MGFEPMFANLPRPGLLISEFIPRKPSGKIGVRGVGRLLDTRDG